jgi:hypothetical protein
MAQTIPLSVPDDLLEEVRETARLTQLSMQDVFRQSTRIGLPALRASVKAAAPHPRRLSLWDALTSGDGLNVRFATAKGKVKQIAL